jgi:hypothetical protein
LLIKEVLNSAHRETKEYLFFFLTITDDTMLQKHSFIIDIPPLPRADRLVRQEVLNEQVRSTRSFQEMGVRKVHFRNLPNNVRMPLKTPLTASDLTRELI